MTEQKKVFFPNLDSLRLIAFLFVFCEHILWNVIRDLHIPKDSFFNHVLYNLFCNGEFGVSVFFVLSGFLITYLILSEISLNGKLDVGSFYIRRFLRIWPLYFAVVIFTFILFPFIQHKLGIYQESCARPWYYFTFLSNFDLINVAHNCYGHSSMQAGVTWSVAIEEQFYLFWPLVFVFLPRKSFKLVCLFLIVTALVFRIINARDAELIYFHTLGVIGDLAIGGLAAYFAFFSERFVDFFRELRPANTVFVYVFCFVIIICGDYFVRHPLYNAVMRSFNIAFFAFVIMHQNFNKYETLKLGRLKFFSKWGRYTYGLYLLHPLASIAGNIFVKKFWGDTEAFAPDLMRAFLILLLTFAGAWLSYRFFEMPFLRLKKKFSYIRRE